MLKKVLEKIDGTTYKTTLEHKKKDYKYFKSVGLEKNAEKIQGSVAGYVQALRDCGIITESDRQKLFLYYGTI